jgi:hypothetical protein
MKNKKIEYEKKIEEYLEPEKCVCGKTYKPYIESYINEEGKKIKTRVGYPTLACHCNCGKRWGQHEFTN